MLMTNWYRYSSLRTLSLIHLIRRIVRRDVIIESPRTCHDHLQPASVRLSVCHSSRFILALSPSCVSLARQAGHSSSADYTSHCLQSYGVSADRRAWFPNNNELITVSILAYVKPELLYAPRQTTLCFYASAEKNPLFSPRLCSLEHHSTR